MKSKLVVVFFLLIASSIFAGGEKEKADTAPIVLKFGAVENTEHKFYPTAVQFAKDVESLTNGAVKIELFWSGELGNAIELMEAIQLGVIDITVQASSIGQLERNFELFDLPFLFADAVSARKVLDGPVGEEMGQLFSKKGIKLLGYWELGFRYITSKKPIRVPSDMVGMKIRVPDNKLRIETFEVLGASPSVTSLSELYIALSQGVMDATEQPFGTIIGYKFYEVQKYLALSRHVFTPGYLLINEKSLKKIPEKYQTAIFQASKKATQLVRELSDKEEAESIDLLKKHGMQITQIDTPAFQAAVKPVWDKWGEKFSVYLQKILVNTP
jgi:tripartite ATP-independent transporter DctP family solute receptor